VVSQQSTAASPPHSGGAGDRSLAVRRVPAGGCELSLTGVHKSYRLGRRRAVEAVGGVSLDVGAGEFVALLGASGCGKSTILRLVAGLEEPSTGAVLIGAESPATLAAAHRLGVAFQDHALLPWLSVAQNVALPFRIARRPVERDRVAELLDTVGLAAFAEARPAQLSGGMRQRASIARALVLRPSVLLLDEPFGALDAITRRRLNEELQRVWQAEAITTLLVTHSVEEALFLADRIVVLTDRPGRVATELAVPFERPRHSDLRHDPRFQRLVRDLEHGVDVREERTE
jgi:NitT/TauT family transport system ATP-binding protein